MFGSLGSLALPQFPRDLGRHGSMSLTVCKIRSADKDRALKALNTEPAHSHRPQLYLEGTAEGHGGRTFKPEVRWDHGASLYTCVTTVCFRHEEM